MIKNRPLRSGFTIVELLIVIVVIGILAAITIVAYNGVTSKARASVAQTDLENANKQFEIAKATSSGYPTAIDCSATPATNTICLKPSNGATYTYYANNTVNPAAYCMTTTNGATVYSTSSSQPNPAPGACPTLTNLSLNPSFETDINGWGSYNGYISGGTPTADRLRMTDGGAIGSSYQRLQWTYPSGDGTAGPYEYSIAVVPGQVYTISAYVRTNKARTITVAAEWYKTDNSSSGTSSIGAPVSIPANTWTRVSATTSAAPTSTAKATVTFYGVTTSAPFAVNDTYDIDGLMVTNGSTLYSYADGASPNGWAWTGTANASTSTGVGL